MIRRVFMDKDVKAKKLPGILRKKLTNVYRILLIFQRRWYGIFCRVGVRRVKIGGIVVKQHG